MGLDCEDVLIVSGLPRSGTSMIMGMLAAAGLPLLVDGERPPDVHNPRGYYEFTPVKKIRDDNRLLFSARGKAVKIVSPLLRYLPPALPCRILLVQRDIGEVLASQRVMLGQDPAPDLVEDTVRAAYLHLDRTLPGWLAQRPATHLLVLQHADVLRDPRYTASAIAKFLELELPLGRMAQAVDPALHRQRSPLSG